jgi:hypothetical protein
MHTASKRPLPLLSTWTSGNHKYRTVLDVIKPGKQASPASPVALPLAFNTVVAAGATHQK